MIFQGHPSWRALLGFYLKGILVAAIVGVLVKLFGGGSADVFLVVLVLIAGTVLIGFVRRMATTYTITSRRLNIRRGCSRGRSRRRGWSGSRTSTTARPSTSG